MKPMRINPKVIEKIQEEEQKWDGREFGGYLLVKSSGYVKDIVFDVEWSNTGFVQFDVKQLVKLKDRDRRLVKGWFHKHPITGLSWTDRNTTIKLTKFWGECYTMVLQSNDKILLVKTVHGPEFKAYEYSMPTFSGIFKKKDDKKKDIGTEKFGGYFNKSFNDAKEPKEMVIEAYSEEIPYVRPVSKSSGDNKR